MPDPIALNLARLLHRLLVDPRGWRVDSIKRELGIKDRTYRKYRGTLSLHFEHLIDPSGRWRVEEVQEGEARYLRLLPNDGPSEERPGFLARAVSYWMVRDVFAFAGDSALNEALEGPWADLVQGIRDKPFFLRHLLRNIDRMLHFVPDAPKDYTGHEATLSTLLAALFYTRRIGFEYASGEGTKWRKQVVCPLTLVMWRSALYLVAAYEPDGKPYLFAVDRMRGVRSRRDRFEYPDATVYHPEVLFEGSFGIWQDPDGRPTEVELIFAAKPYLQRYLRERTWHPSQQFEDQDDGRLRLAFTVTSMVEVWPWLRSFGDDVEVISPTEDRSGAKSASN
jgi:predicted DNA-binding transcriptional regulator YafY